MSAKQALCDQDVVDLQASPAKSEASSVDIYDGLDMSVTVPDETTKPSSSPRDCLDLYEELIAEEGTAKEASFNNLNAEYEKSQKQMKQLVSKLKEMQCLNNNLQNENQCLKKNISALIKTARVELTRKEEEINRLNQRLCVPGSTRSFKPNTVPLLSVNTKLKNNEPSKDPINKTSSIRKEGKPQGTSKDQMGNSSSTKSCSEQAKSSVESNSESNAKMEQRHCKESEGTEKQTSRHKVMVDEKTKREMNSDSQSRDVDRRQRSEGHRSSLSTVTDDGICEIKEKSLGQPTKTGKSERSQETRNSKKSDDCKMDSRKHSSASHDKPSFSKENTRSQELHQSKEKYIKTHEKSQHRKESKGYEQDKTVKHKHRTLEKDDGSQRLNRTHFSTLKNDYSQKSSPSEQNKRSIDSDRKDKRCSEYSGSKNVSKDSKSSKNEVRPSPTKVKYKCDSKSLSDRDNRAEKKKSKDEDDVGFDQNHRGHRKEKVSHHSSNKVKMQDCPSRAEVNSQNLTKSSTCQKEDNSVKNLKLSFMETLNLTLSPAKKKNQDSESANSPVSAKETGIDFVNIEVSSKVCTSTKDGGESEEHLGKPSLMDLKHSTKLSVADPISSDDLRLVHHSESEDTSALHREQSTVTIKEGKALAESTQSNIDCLQVLHMEPKANISDDVDTQSILDDSDLIVLDSYIEIDKCSDNEISSANLNMPVPAENVQDNGVILSQITEDVDQTSDLKPNMTRSTTGICESSNTDQCLHDESSVISLDLNFLRRIPKVVSPLKSPARPLAHLPTTERTTKASVVSVSYKDLPSDVNMRTPNELNKENCEPVSKTDKDSETFPIEISSDEVEEGEIISDEEPDNEQTSQSKSSPSQTEPIKGTNVMKSPESQESKVASLTKPNGVISPLRQSTSKAKKKTKENTKAKLLALPVDRGKNVSADSCLEGVLKIVPPSNIQDVLQMLRIIRKHIRKKYMKFKIQFPLSQFHRFVEAASLCFTTLANRLDWSRLCSSPDKLQNKMCKVIESRLKQLKKNGIVDRIFEQRLIDMKKRLWKFVEEQLDSLFDTLKGVIIKLCGNAKLETDQDENKISAISSTKLQKSDQIKSQKVNKTKASVAKSENERCLRRLDFQYQRDAANTKPQTTGDPSVEKKLLKDLSTTCDKISISPGHHTSLKPNMSSSSTAKPNPSNECQIDQQSSAGLSFNLVSDDHMGDIFKTLLNDNLEFNTLHENIWILDTPEKKSTSSQRYDAVNSLTEIKTPVKVAFPWTSISPPHIGTLPRHETVLTPDVFDESCLLEVPTSTSSSKSVATSEDRFKSYSVLMEDLAVSLTVPSPLKSDSHLSFLRPVYDTESLSKINAHFSEDAVLDEEDATEEDIHLTLDSDNSNPGSPENSTEPDGFQCHPSEPMQAVIMEKSNDHFIVKIRRAVSSNSPLSDSSLVVEADIAATGQLESTHGNILDESLKQGIHVETKLKADTENALFGESMVPYSEESSFTKIDEKLEHFTDVKQCTCSSPKNVHSTSVFPDALNQSLTDPSEVELTNVLHTEKAQLDSDKLVTICSESSPKDSDKMKSVEQQLMHCDKMETTFTEEIINCQTPCANTIIGSIPEAVSVDFNPKKKKRKSSEKGPSSKRLNISFLPDKNTKKEGSCYSRTEDEDKPQRKHRRVVSENNVIFSSFKHSPSGGISAKNVIKKKGEVVVSWTRNEDREILLECQQHGPSRKTFLALASKMSKYPHQVEERFRQLMKLFKKSRNSIS